MKNIKSIGRGMFEATCKKCGAVFMIEEGDDLFIEIDDNQEQWPLCSKCYDGERADPSIVKRKRDEILRRKSQEE